MGKPHARPIAVAVNIYPNTLSDKLKMHAAMYFITDTSNLNAPLAMGGGGAGTDGTIAPYFSKCEV